MNNPPSDNSSTSFLSNNWIWIVVGILVLVIIILIILWFIYDSIWAIIIAVLLFIILIALGVTWYFMSSNSTNSIAVKYGDILLLKNNANISGGTFADPCGGSNCSTITNAFMVTLRTDQSYTQSNGQQNKLRQWTITPTDLTKIGMEVSYDDVIQLTSVAINPVGTNPEFPLAVCTSSSDSNCGNLVIVGANANQSSINWTIKRNADNLFSSHVFYGDAINLINTNVNTNNFLNYCTTATTGPGCGASLSINAYNSQTSVWSFSQV